MKLNDVGFFWTNKPNHKIFTKIMNNLLYANEDNWIKILRYNKVNNFIVRRKNTILIRLIDSILKFHN